MKRRVAFAALFLFLVINAGCPYTAKIPIAVPDRSAFDPRLVGEWIASGDAGDTVLVSVYPFNEAEYYVETVEGKDKPDRYRVFAFTVGKERLLHLNELGFENSVHEFVFGRYDLSVDGELTIRFIGEKCVPKSLADDAKALRAFIAAHLDDPALDDEDVKLVMRRKS